MQGVIHCEGKRFSHDNVVYVGRPSKWGNPFVIGKDGDRAAVIRKYEDWVKGKVILPSQCPPTIQDIRRELRGKTLACWCAPAPCHADVLYRIANGEEA
jgi:hypothetical protein